MAQLCLMSIEELRNRGANELARLLKASEQEKLRLTAEHSRVMKEVNRKQQAHVTEIQSLQEQNKKLLTENEELRDLCCFLDSSRQKDQRAVQEWQKFGRYTSDLMQNDVKTFQNKLGSLETKLELLMKENIELKELCLLLAEDRNERENLLDRVEGDGSSSSSPSNEKVSVSVVASRDNAVNYGTQASNDEMVQYLRYLEAKVSNLEQENCRLTQSQKSADGQDYRRFVLTAEPSPALRKPYAPHPRTVGSVLPNRHRLTDNPPGQPPMTNENVNAMKVLSVHNQLDNPSYGSEQDVMDESEKAIVRQMCNVVWRKLGGVVPGYKTAV